MKHIGMTLAVVGGLLLTVGRAEACEAHRARAEPVEPGRQEKAPRAEPAPQQEEAGEVHAARCRCSSAADCTCKKGSCECSKCKKPRQDVAVPREEASLPTRPAGVLT